MNVKLLRRIQKHILAEPRRLVMLAWGGRHEGLLYSINRPRDLSPSPPPCGTVGCIAGWACQLSTKSPGKDLGFDGSGALILFEGSGIQASAARLLDIDYYDAEKLFMLPEQSRSSWPRKYARLYEAAKSAKGRARITAQRIDHFIATKGKE